MKWFLQFRVYEVIKGIRFYIVGRRDEFLCILNRMMIADVSVSTPMETIDAFIPKLSAIIPVNTAPIA